MGCRVVLAAAVIALAGSARAEPASVEVRSLPGASVAPEMIDTLRIHLAGAATVGAGAPLRGVTLAERIEEASGGLDAGGLVTWLEPGPEPRSYLVVVVGQRAGRAAVEVGRVDSLDRGAINRLLALRVGAFLDETIAAGASSPIAAPAAARAAVNLPRPAPRGRLHAIGELGGGGEGDGGGVHGDGAIAIGARHATEARRVEAVAIGRLGWPRHQRGTAGEVSLTVADLALGARLVVPAGPAWLGAAAEIGARRVRADGMAFDGGEGVAVRWLARTRLGLDARLAVSPAVTVRATVGVERGLAIERFAVNGAALGEVGGLAAAGGVWVLFPLGRP